MNAESFKTKFWDMFIVDALIENWDRHNGNCGFLYNNATDEEMFARYLIAKTSFVGTIWMTSVLRTRTSKPL